MSNKNSASVRGLIISGRNLAPKDPNGLSDPFTEFGIVDKKGEWVPNDKKDHKCAKSKTLRKTLAPVWRTPFDFTIDSKCKALRVQVWDWDYVGASEFMGEALIPLSEMPVGKEVEGWYKLNTRPSKPREVVSGEIYLRYLYTATGVAADANVSEEERVALDDIRSGEIELIVLALQRHVSSLAVLKRALPAVFKWAATSQTKERVTLLSKHKGRLFEVLIKAVQSFPDDGVVVFYGLGCFTFFTKVVEAKVYVKDDYVRLISNSINAPPTLPDSDKPLHIANCLITLANLCTFKFDNQYSNEVKRLQMLSEESGGIQHAIQALRNYERNEHVMKAALSLLLKCLRSNDAMKDKYNSSGVPDEMIRLLKRSKNISVRWLAVDVLETWVRSADSKQYAEHFLQIHDSIKIASFSDAEGPHPASLNTIVSFLLEALSPSFTPEHLNAIAEEKTIIPGVIQTYKSYRKYIPKEFQKPWLAERILRLLTTLCALPACRQQIVKSHDGWIRLISEQHKVESVQKLIVPFLEILLAEAECVEKLKSTDLGKVLEHVSGNKPLDKLKEKLK